VRLVNQGGSNGDADGEGDARHDASPAFAIWAHQPNDGLSSQEWEQQVVDFVYAMRTIGGIDLDVDLFHLSRRGADWTRLGPSHVAAGEHIRVIVNAAWRERWEGRNPPTVGAGAVAEANVLHSIFSRNQEEFGRRVVLVLLPGSSDDDIPDGWHGVQRRRVDDFALAGLTELLRLLTSQPQYEPPPVGAVPALPPKTGKSIALQEHDVLQVSISDAAPASDSVTASVQSATTAHPAQTDESATEEQQRKLAAIELLKGLQRQTVAAPLDASTAGSSPQVAQIVAGLQAQLAELDTPTPSAQQFSARHAALVQTLTGRIDRTNRCWLVLSAIPDPPAALPAGIVQQSPRDRAHDRLRQWAQKAELPVLLDTSTPAFRQPGRVVFPGEHDWQGGGQTVSTRYRVELADDGAGLAAADVAGVAQLQPGTGQVAFAGWPGQSVLDSAVYLSVRQDWLELWLLTELELLVDHARSSGSGAGAVLQLEVRLELPAALSLEGHHEPRPIGVRLVHEQRDADGRRVDDEPLPGAADLPLSETPCAAPALAVVLEVLSEPQELVRTARRLATGLLEHFGVEQTAVLRPDGTLDAFAAAGAQQQLVHQHARRLGLPVDAHSPLDRRRQCDQLLAEARARLTP